MVIRTINRLHNLGYRKLLALISIAMYRLKGYGKVDVQYHELFRGYEYRVNHVSYISIGPGWAYTYDYLHKLLVDSFCYFYIPMQGDCIVDIGAGLGEEAVIFSLLVKKSGKVFAIEANPVTFAGLRFMIERNSFLWTIPFNLAIYSSDTEVMIEDSSENYLKNTISMGSSGFRVQAKTLDTIVQENNISSIDFLKCNIEGAEQFLIEGMSTVSLGIIRNLCISCHDFRSTVNHESEFYKTKDKVISFLEKNGFDIKTRNTGNPVVDDYVYAQRQ